GSGIARVWSHTILTPGARDRVLKLGCDGVMTDAPRLLARTDGRDRTGVAAGPASTAPTVGAVPVSAVPVSAVPGRAARGRRARR
ncbi:MAG TPA: hypothetical protein VNS49_03095, partial [Streptomyces sp.]|nr:hypothetical protein [Streptomyces sp.]